MKNGFLFLIILVSGGFAFAENEHGNGGDVVVCRDAGGAIKSARLLDYYEGKLYKNIDVDLGPANLSVDAKVKILADRLAERNPIRATKYIEKYKTFMSEAQLLPNIELTDVNDSAHVAVEKGCKIEQIVIQKEPKFPGDKRYTISADLWNALNNDHKAGLIWHEIIYREASGSGSENSIASRYFNSLTAGNLLLKMSTSEWLQIMSELRLFKDIEVSGIAILLGRNEKPQPGTRLNAVGGEYTLYGKTFKINGGTVSFFENGVLRDVIINSFNDDNSPRDEIFEFVSDQGVKIKFVLGYNNRSGFTSFSESKKLLAGVLAEDTVFHVGQSSIVCMAFQAFSLFENGQLRMCNANTQTVIKTTKFDFKIYEGQVVTHVEYDSEGKLIDLGGGFYVVVRGQVLIQGRWVPITDILFKSAPEEKNMVLIYFSVANPHEDFKVGDLTLSFFGTLNFVENEKGQWLQGGKLQTKKFPWRLANGVIAYFGNSVKCGFWGGEKTNSEIGFKENQISSAMLVEDAQIYDSKGQLQTFRKGTYVHFDEKGFVHSDNGNICD